jgi:hypothetical protein
MFVAEFCFESSSVVEIHENISWLNPKYTFHLKVKKNAQKNVKQAFTNSATFC